MAIKLGGGGGSASQVNDVKYIHSDATLITTESGEKWQLGGYGDNTDTTAYPNATTFKGNPSTNTDSEVSLAGTTTGDWSKDWSSTITTNGTWVWNGNSSSVGNNIIYARKLDGTGSQVQASDGSNFTNLNGKLLVIAHGDGYLYSMWASAYSSGFANRYHALQRHTINNSNGTLSNATYMNSTIDLGPYWLEAVCAYQVYGRNDNLLWIGKNSSNEYRAFKVYIPNGNTTVVKNWTSTDIGVSIPSNLFSIHEFNGHLYMKGSDNYLYKYALNLDFVEKINVGTGNNFFSKNDATSSAYTDTYDSIASSASGVHNFQRLYQVTDNGFKSHPPETIVGTPQANTEGTNINQYVRIL